MASEMTAILLDRFLQGDNETTIAPTPSRVITASPGFVVPTLAPLPDRPMNDGKLDDDDNDDDNASFGRGVKLLLVVFLLALGAYQLYKCYRRRRETYLMHLRSAQADQVLGDMQMIPSEDPDADLL
jgi:hypothetical protein